MMDPRITLLAGLCDNVLLFVGMRDFGTVSVAPSFKESLRFPDLQLEAGAGSR